MESFIRAVYFFKGNRPEDIVAKYGTPVYVYNEDILRDRMRKVSRIITKYEFHSNYSIKANTNINILKIALSEGLYADAMSVGEMRILLDAGFPAEKIFFVSNNVSA
jgi:diaminopimelate decarboxylase